jgi:hypothetical protein
MQEFEITFKECLRKGLRDFGNNPRFLEALTECYNLKPNPIGLVPFEPLAHWSVVQYTAWPYHQIFYGAFFKLHCHANVVDYYDLADNLLHSVIGIPGGWWSCVDYGTFIILGNGQCIIYTDMSLPIPVPVMVQNMPNVPRAVSMCDYKGQLVLGGILSDWYNCDYRYVVWSKIGEVDNCLPDLTNEAGYRIINNIGEVLRVLRLGDYIIIYGTTCSVAIHPHDATFGMREFTAMGISNSRAVDGDEFQHVVVDRLGQLWRLKSDLTTTFLGYREWISQFNLETVIVSYDRIRREFYITDPHCGNQIGPCIDLPKCYVLNDIGLFEVHQIPTSIANKGDVAYATYIDNGDYSWRITTDTLDFQQRTLKTLQVIELGGQYDYGNVSARVHWADGHIRNRNTFNIRNWVNLNPMGWTTPIITAQDFRVSLRGSSYEDSTLNIDYLKFRYKYPDRRVQRGLSQTNI